MLTRLTITLLTAILIEGCVTYTPVNVPAAPVPIAKPIPPAPKPECPQQKLTPLPPIEAPLNLRIEKGDEPVGDANGVKFVWIYVNAQKEIKAHNKRIEQCGIK